MYLELTESYKHVYTFNRKEKGASHFYSSQNFYISASARELASARAPAVA